MPRLNRLSQRQEEFALAYVASDNAAEAYRKAYDTGKMSPKTIKNKGYQLTKNELVAARIAELKAKRTERAEVELHLSETWVMEQLVSTYEAARKGKPVTDKEGIVVGFAHDLKAANRSLELIGKKIGIFGDQRKKGRKGRLLEDVSDEELRQILDDALAEIAGRAQAPTALN